MINCSGCAARRAWFAKWAAIAKERAKHAVRKSSVDRGAKGADGDDRRVSEKQSAGDRSVD